MSLLHWIVRVQDIKSARDMSPDLAIKYARLALGEYVRGHFPAQASFADWPAFVDHLKSEFLPKKLDWQLAIGLSGLCMNGTDYNWYLSQFVSHVDQMKEEQALITFCVLGLHHYLRWEVSRSNPDTMHAAMEKARECSLEVPPPWYSPASVQPVPALQTQTETQWPRNTLSWHLFTQSSQLEVLHVVA